MFSIKTFCSDRKGKNQFTQGKINMTAEVEETDLFSCLILAVCVLALYGTTHGCLFLRGLSPPNDFRVSLRPHCILESLYWPHCIHIKPNWNSSIEVERVTPYCNSYVHTETVPFTPKQLRHNHDRPTSISDSSGQIETVLPKPRHFRPHQSSSDTTGTDPHQSATVLA